MACATLKRHLDWDSLSGLAPRQAKRRRFVPFSAAVPSRPKETPSSVFQDAAPKLTPEFIATSVCHEVRLLQRRKQLPPFSLNSPPCSPTSATSSATSSAAAAESSNSNTPLFTFKQVNMICERMVREREDELRQHYDKVLNDKLAEQYDAFVRFTQDQIHRRFANEAAPSYCS